MNQQVNMPGMASVGGPVGGPMINNNNNNNNNNMNDPVKQLNTYIYDYFLKNGHHELARMVHNQLPIMVDPQAKPSPRRDVNGVHDTMDEDSKDNLRPVPNDLPKPRIPGGSGNDNCFLFDWWSQFWDVYSAQRGKSKGPTQLYLQHSQNKTRIHQAQQQQMLQQMNPQMMGNNMAQYKMLPQNGMMPSEMQRQALANANRANAGRNLQQMKNMQNMQQQQQMMQQQGQMQREGSAMGIGQDRPQSPAGSGDNAPSPKRQRTEANGFNGMAPAGRGQPQGMPGQPNFIPEKESYSQHMANQQRALMMNINNPNMAKGIPNVGGIPQTSPMNVAQNPEIAELYARNGGPPMNGAAGGQGGNHALQDYQMQLMLLEQQNKKRLLMARQEQDNINHGPPGPGGPGPGMQPGFPQGMSPSARPGPSPNPNDMKRGTPKMGTSPLPDGTMPNQGSPAPNFDPSQMPQGMPPQFYQQMKPNEGMQMGPNGTMMRPQNSNPAMPAALTQEQQMAAMRRQAGMQNGGMGFPPGGPPNMMQQPQPQQQPPNMRTPQQQSMPPPPAPQGSAEASRTQPSSPAPAANPPTPSQTKKNNPKKKNNAGNDNKNSANKKGAAGAGATPASEPQEPPTPTPSTPITPMHPGSFGNQQKNGVAAQANANASQAVAAAAAAQPQPPPPQPQPDANAGQFDIDTSNLNLNFDFAPVGESDILQDFDFDSFLHPDGQDGMAFPDPNFAFGGETLEAGTGPE